MASGTYGWQGDALEFPAGLDATHETGVSPEGRARLRYNDLTASLEVSLDGGAYVLLGTGGGASPWVEVGGTVRLQNIAWNVVIGAAAMVGSEKLRVVGDIRVDSTVFVSEVSNVPGSGLPLNLTNDVGVGLIQLGAGITIEVGDDDPAGLQVLQGLNSYINLSTVNGSESIRFGGAASTTLGADIVVGVASLSLGVPDNAGQSFLLHQGANNYISIDTSNGTESLVLGNTLSSVGVAVKDNSSLAFQILQGANNQLAVNTNNGTESLVLGNTTTNPDIIFDTGGDVTFPSTAICLFELGADPAAVANAVKLYAVDDGGGNSVLRVRFDDGAITQLSGNALSIGGAEAINRSGTAVQVGAGTDDSIFLANSNGSVALLTTGFGVITDGAGTGFTWSSLAFSIPERVGDPGAVANVGKLYTKDVAGVTQLFYQRSDGTVVALTP